MKDVCPMAPDATIEKIHTIKKAMGRKLIILTHHYQRPETVACGDYAGDSFGLARKAATDSDAQYIVFCGVHFMAESAAILAQPNGPDPRSRRRLLDGGHGRCPHRSAGMGRRGRPGG